MYVLSCSDVSYYIGSKKNPELRLAQLHHDGEEANHTKKRLRVKLVYD
jgi:putative endonuclease